MKAAIISAVALAAVLAGSPAHAERHAKNPGKTRPEHASTPAMEAPRPTDNPVKTEPEQVSAPAAVQASSLGHAQPVSNNPVKIGPNASAPGVDTGSGFAFGVRGAYHVPMGTLGASARLSDVVAGGIPLWIEAGYRFNPNLYAGAVVQWASNISAGCPTGGACSSSDLRLGLEAIYTFLPRATFTPWTGIGAGYDVLSWSRAGSDSSAKGFELLNVQVGADWNATSAFSVGPFAAITVAKFSSTTSGGVTTDYTESGMHDWLQFGIRASWRL